MRLKHQSGWISLDQSQNRIPFNSPFTVGRELEYITQAVAGGHLAGDGRFTKLCNQWLEERYDLKKVLLTHSCTAALEMAAILAEIEPGDEVIIPSFTFVSTANAFAIRGARINFVDIRPDTLNLDENLVEDAVTPRTKAIVPVHYAGVGCEMDVIMEIAARHNLLVIEDAAQGIEATYKGKPLGSFGHMSAFSFHETKNFISGEGGAIGLNDLRFVNRAEIIREKGANRSQYFRGQVDKYTWVDIGSSYLPSELIAAFLYAQLEESEKIAAKRSAIYHRYARELAELETLDLIRTPKIPSYCIHNSHMFYILTESLEVRTALIDHLRNQNIFAVFHYVPLHSSPMGKRVGFAANDLPVTNSVSDRLLRLPFYYGLTEADQLRVIAEVKRFYRV